MKNLTILSAVFVILSLSSLEALSAGPVEPAAAPRTHQKENARWSAKMRSLYLTLSSLMTDVSSDSRFNDKRRRSAIEANAKKLADLAHDLKGKDLAPPDRDPSIAIFSSVFAEGARLAYRSLKAGYRDEYSRERLRSLPGYCIACHTRNQSGPTFASLPIEPDAKDLRAIERGTFYASTRQYDRALTEFNTVIESERTSVTQPFEWTHAVKYALAIAVRVKHNPDLAKTIVQKLIISPQAPYFMKEDAKHWLESIEDWSKEPSRIATSEEGLYSEAVRLLAQAHELQKYPVDHSADILYLRASAAVHDLLQIGPNGRHAGEAYLMAGIGYEVLSSFNTGEIQDIYYEVCVRTQPHTPLAIACFNRYQESIFAGYTGSAGTHMPLDEKDKMKFLENLAKPVEQPVRVQN